MTNKPPIRARPGPKPLTSAERTPEARAVRSANRGKSFYLSAEHETASGTHVSISFRPTTPEEKQHYGNYRLRTTEVRDEYFDTLESARECIQRYVHPDSPIHEHAKGLGKQEEA